METNKKSRLKILSAGLSQSEIDELLRREKSIDSKLHVVEAIGNDLLAIREKRLYRAEYKIFEDYCEKRWRFGRRRALYLMDAAIVAQGLTPKTRTMVPKERQLRALRNVPQNQREAVVEQVAKTGPVTAKRIAEVAGQSRNGNRQTKPETVRDDTGYVVPMRAMEFWERKEEARRILKFISEARCAVKELSADDPMWSEVNLNGVLSDLNNAYNNFATAVPYAVCATCQGVQPKTCTLCKGRGVISKFRFDHAVPEELKKIRAKACA